ncbi:Fe-S cluster assembly scaffold protein NifU [Candidatus Micrarchaeota archaeon]|nr:Fe-S cluster assembly scaffold protein NifU [Candidatus Micrarchaeota archaeon]MBU2476261.1 Fe-S cluster assembly scaffold protein NifU [Candidatus Micrarchaeota archaeon]
MYSKKVMEEFKNPKNIGKIEDPDAVGEVGNPICGDMMKVYLKIKDNKIIDVKVETFGCVSAIATSSKATEMVKGKTLEDAMKLTEKEVADELDGLPPIKFHCSVLAVKGIKKAIENYREKQKK